MSLLVISCGGYHCSKTKGENKNEKRIPQLQFHLSYDPLAIYRIQWE